MKLFRFPVRFVVSQINTDSENIISDMDLTCKDVLDSYGSRQSCDFRNWYMLDILTRDVKCL